MIKEGINGKGGLGSKIKDRLIQQALERRAREIDDREANGPKVVLNGGRATTGEEWTRFDRHPGYQRFRLMKDGAGKLGVADPFFQQLEGVSGPTAVVGGRELVNFSGYNYLGLSGHPEVNAAACRAIEEFGTSVSASRIVSGERRIHRELEEAIAKLYGVDDSIAMVSGHATAVTTLGYLFGPRDLILHDALAHNCAVEGARLSGAKRLSFPHNDVEALGEILERVRHQHERVCIVIEGLYSMDGDYPELPAFVEMKRRHGAFLMVDEAHSLGVLGSRGLGIAEHFGIEGREVDLWMGTLSKSLASCGGFIAGEQALVDNLKFAAPGFVYSVGMPPATTAAAVAALELMRAEPERVARLHEICAYFLEKAKSLGVDTGLSRGLAIVPAIVGSSLKAARLSHAMRERGVNVQPILYPAVSEKAARLRFFLSCGHTREQVDFALDALVGEWRRA